MLDTVKIIASAAAILIALIAYIPYLIDMFRGNNKPHLYTWISIFIVTIVVAYIQVIGGAGIGALPTILGAGINVVILFYCFRFGTKDIVFIDKVCLAVTIIGVISYALLSSRPLVSLVILTIAEVVSFVPTFRKTRNDPYSESLPSYYLLLLKIVLILIALQAYNLLTISYPLLWLVVIMSFLIAVYRWRAKKPRPANIGELQEAPLI